MLYSVDAEDRLVAVSDYWLLATGYERANVLGRRFADFVADCDRAAYESRREISGGVTVKFLCFDGRLPSVPARGRPCGSESGPRIAWSLSVMTDVTDLRAAEQRNHLQRADRRWRARRQSERVDRHRALGFRLWQHLPLGREPEAVVDQLGIARHQLILEMAGAAIEGNAFDAAMRLQQDGAARGLVDAARGLGHGAREHRSRSPALARP
eukprot:gene8492-11513_t